MFELSRENMTPDTDCVPLDLSLGSKAKGENKCESSASEDESSEYNSDHNAESEDTAAKDNETYKLKKNLMKRYRK